MNKAGQVLSGLIFFSVAPAQAVSQGVPSRYGQVVLSRGEVAGQRYLTARAEFGVLPPRADTPPLGQCEVSRGVLRSREINAEAYGAELGEQGQAAPISAGASLNIVGQGQAPLKLEATPGGYQLEGGPSELLRRIGGVAGPLTEGARLEVPGQAGVYGFPAFSVLIPGAPPFVWQSPETVEVGEVLRWTGASQQAGARVKLLLRQGEGQAALNLVCAAPDTGSFVVPPEVRRELADLLSGGALKVVGTFRSLTTAVQREDAQLSVVLEEGGLH